MLNLNQLRSFYEVAKALNFSVAAEKLCVTQPAISKQVKCFEEFCELKLFYKKRKEIFLADEGKKILVYATQIFEMERQLEEVIIGLKNLKHGALRIGTTKTYARWFISPLLTGFQKKFPNVILDLDEGSSLEMLKSLAEFKNSIAIVAKLENDPDIRFIPLMLEDIVLIASPDHLLAKKSPILFSDLKNIPVVMKEKGSGTRKLIDESFDQEDIKPTIFAQTSNMEFIKQMVRMNKAVSFVVRGAVENELSKGELRSIPIENKKLALKIYFAYMNDHELPYIEKKFFEFVTSSNQGEHLPCGIQSVLDRITPGNPKNAAGKEVQAKKA